MGAVRLGILAVRTSPLRAAVPVPVLIIPLIMAAVVAVVARNPIRVDLERQDKATTAGTGL
jgi:hypothetical protein